MTDPNNIRQGEVDSREVRREPVYVQREDGTGAGVIGGILIAGIFALGVGAFFLFNQRPAAQTPTSSKTTVIERTKEVPVAQPKAPDVNIQMPQPKAPDVNIQTAPPPAPQATTNSSSGVQQSPDAQASPSNP